MGNDCIITANGEDHARRRRLIQPSFTPRCIQGYSEKMVGELERARDALSDGEQIDMDHLATDLSLSIASRAFFGDDMGIDTQLMKDYLASFRWMFGLSHIPFERLARAFPLPRTIAAKRHIAEFHEAVCENIRRTRESSGAQRSHLASGDGVGRRAPQLGLYRGRVERRSARDHRGVPRHHRGNDDLVHLSPGPQPRSARPAGGGSGHRARRGACPASMTSPRLRYARAVVDESLRMTPPVTYLGRVTTEDVVIDGYRIPRDTMVELSIRTPMRHDDYFREQDRFMPERWLTEPKPSLPRMAYAPFGSGIRFCSGFRFALLELVLALSIFAQRWRFDLTFEGFPPIADVLFYKCRKGLPVVVRRRPGQE